MLTALKPWGFLLLLLAALVTTLVWFGSDQTRSTAGRSLRVGLYENSPKIYHDPQGHPAGLFVELLQEIAQEEHWSIHYVPCSWAQCLEQLEAGTIDLMPDVAFSEERSARFDFHQVAVANSWSQIYRRPQIKVTMLSDLSGLKVAVVNDSVQDKFLATLMAGNRLHYTPIYVESYAQGFDAVKKGSADVVVTNHFFGGHNASTYGLKETPIVFLPSTLYFATAKGRNGNILERIDTYLTKWREDPNSIYFAAMKRSMAPPPAYVFPTWLRWALGIGTMLLPLLLLMILILRWEVRRHTAALANANSRLDSMLSASPVVLYLLHHKNGTVKIEWISNNIERLFGFAPAQALNDGWWFSHLYPDDLEVASEAVNKLLHHQTHLIQEYRMFDAQGGIRHIRDEMRITRGINDEPDRIVGTWSDLTEVREHETKLNFLANHDPLTGLPNRSLFNEKVAASLRWAQQSGTQIAVLHIDLDRFKTINETLGHSFGDIFLREVAHKISQVIDAGETLARLDGDAFGILIDKDAGFHRITEVSRKVLNLSAQPLTIGPHQLVVTSSIGISLFPADGDDVETLLKNAELAMYEAKKQGRNTFRFFASELSAGVFERLVMENSLRGAINRNELVLYYQPQVDLTTGKLVGVEALVRWQHPQIGLVPPAQFIPLAEELGIIDEIGVWVMREACQQMIAWQANGLYVPRMAVNLSVRQIKRDILSMQVKQVLQDTHLEAERLELEVTESSIMREPEKAIAALADLKALGIKLAIDDFGIGHSSLANLKRMPVDRLKIDQSFVRDIGRDINDEAISRTVIHLARSLDMETVAEGIEREEQAEFLLCEGCHIGQGYFYSNPLPAGPRLDAWLKART